MGVLSRSSSCWSNSSAAGRVLLAMLGIALAGCAGEEETRARKCERLREHVIDLRIDGVPKRDREAHATALRNALSSTFTDECMALSNRQLSCALGATDVVASAACISGSSR